MPLISTISSDALLELTLTIHASDDMARNCRNFLRQLNQLLRISTCSIWWADKEQPSVSVCVARYHHSIINRKLIRYNHPLCLALGKNPHLNFTRGDHTYEDLLAADTRLQKGAFAFIGLEGLGFLCFHDSKRDEIFEIDLFATLRPVLQHLGLALKQYFQLQKLQEKGNQLKHEIGRYQRMTNTISDGIMITNLQREILYINDQVTHMSGYPIEDIVGKKVEDIHIYKDTIPEMKRKINECLRGKHSTYYMVHKHKTSGQKWWSIVNIAPFRDSEGQIIGGIGTIRDISLQFQAEQSLRASEERYRMLFDNAYDGVIVFDIEQIKAITINDKMLELLGYTYDEFKQVAPRELSPVYQPNGVASEEIMAKYRRQVIKKGRIQYEWEHRRKDGSSLLVEVTTVNLPSPNEHLVIAIHKDITEKKKAESALRASEQRYRLLFDNAFDGIVIFDSERNEAVACNQKILEYFRCDEATFLKLHPLELSPSHQPSGLSSKAARKDLLQQLNRNQLYRYEWTHQRLDGTFFDTELSTFTLPPPDQHLRISILRDITERKKAEGIIRESEERFRSLFEQSPLGMAISKDFTDPLLVNPKLCEMLGYHQEELNGQKTIADLTHPEDRALHISLYDEISSGEKRSVKLQKRYLRKDGSTMWGDVTISTLQDKSSRTTSYLAFIEDITNQKYTNDALRFISSQVAESSGQDFFWQIVETIAQTFDMDYVLIGEIDPKQLQGQSRAFYARGKRVEHQYDLSHSPCADAIAQRKTLSIETNVKDHYPMLPLFPKRPIQSCITLPLFDSKDQVIGHIVLMNEGKMHNLPTIQNVLNIYSTRVASELERQNNENTLRNTTSQLQEAQRIARLGNWEYEVASHKITWSKEIFSILQRPEQNGPPAFEDFGDLLLEEDRPMLRDKVEQALAFGTPWELESRYVANGQIIYTIGKGEAVQENGKTVKLVGTVQDISHMKEAEIKLKETTQKYQDLFANMYDALLVVDENGYFKDSNKAAQQLLEYSYDQLQHIRISDIVHPDDRAQSKMFLDNLIKDGYYSNYEGRIITQSGKVKYLQVNSNAIYDKQGNFTGSRDIARDITTLKETEQRQQQLFEQLERANQELKDFAYIVSHDLKAPLRAIGSLSQWLYEDYFAQLNEQGRQHLKLLINRVNRMHNFIEGILTYSRLGRIKVARESVDCQQLVENVIDSLDPPEHISIQIATPLPVVDCEKIRIQQVFQNLISNAIKYNDKANGTITIHYTEKADAHQFAVEDNGPGISTAHFAKIFQIFQTLQSRDQYESTGIGLTIVKRIVELHGGKIHVESEMGKGTTFVFTLKKS